ncbi:MAG: DUF4416 family protein [Deltaproteobacteria bacterium]|jgi:hypothetical protein|nr:DUF4416 family protein [Deltaproteobacteria bacterium]
MSLPQPPKPAKLVIGFFLKEKRLAIDVVKALVEKLGPVDITSPWLPFNLTTYYADEMGTPLFRRMLAFKRLIKQSALANIKLFTNDLERKYSIDDRRAVNIDPGYLLHERFVLATGKNYSHRIYIGSEIYADLTLVYLNGHYNKMPWTYPDYASENVMTFLEWVRKKYVIDLG